jgi:hypothetical protein
VDGFSAIAARTRRDGFIQSEQSGDQPIQESEVGDATAGAIHDQKLMFGERIPQSQNVDLQDGRSEESW